SASDCCTSTWVEARLVETESRLRPVTDWRISVSRMAAAFWFLTPAAALDAPLRARPPSLWVSTSGSFTAATARFLGGGAFAMVLSPSAMPEKVGGATAHPRRDREILN